MLDYGLVGLAVIVFCLAIVNLVHRLRRKSLSLPPGPPPESWLFGNTLPTSRSQYKYEEWIQQYGPVFSLRQGLTTIVIIGRNQPTIDIMEREGASLVDRPVSIAGGETLSGGLRMSMISAGPVFRKMRKALHSHLNIRAVPAYMPILMKNAKRHVLDILEKPEYHQEHARRYAASVVMAVAYGKSIQGYDDPEISAINHCLARFGSAIRPGLWKVDYFPWLRYVPGYLKELQDGHREELALFKRHLESVRAKFVGDKPTPSSFSKYLLSEQSSLGLSGNQAAYLAGTLFGAGSDTTAAAISVSVMAAACFPDAQRRVQEELEAVLGNERAPTFADQDDLPQLNAFVLETLRWRPITPGALPHKATKDIVWQNYIIPKGATVIGNLWSINRDPTVFPNPELFDPQRWLTAGGRIKDDLKAFTFGFGRRVCPGQHIASASVYLNTALMLWAFNIRSDPVHPIDQLAFSNSAISHPLPFKATFEPRIGGTGGKGIKELLERSNE